MYVLPPHSPPPIYAAASLTDQQHKCDRKLDGNSLPSLACFVFTLCVRRFVIQIKQLRCILSLSLSLYLQHLERVDDNTWYRCTALQTAWPALFPSKSSVLMIFKRRLLPRNSEEWMNDDRERLFLYYILPLLLTPLTSMRAGCVPELWADLCLNINIPAE